MTAHPLASLLLSLLLLLGTMSLAQAFVVPTFTTTKSATKMTRTTTTTTMPQQSPLSFATITTTTTTTTGPLFSALVVGHDQNDNNNNDNNNNSPDTTKMAVDSATSTTTTTTDNKTLDDSWTTPTTLQAADNIISSQHPLRVLIAGAGIGGLTLAHDLTRRRHGHSSSNNNNDSAMLLQVMVLEQTTAFQRFGGPIQLASNAMQILRQMSTDHDDHNHHHDNTTATTTTNLYQQIVDKFTVTGDKKNGIKDGIRTEWYAEFDLQTPAQQRDMPYTGVIDRPDLQQIFLQALPAGTVQNGDGVVSYEHVSSKANGGGGGVKAILESGKEVYGDVLIGADGIWSAVRATMRDTPRRGDASGATYSGYTLYAGELKYTSPDNGQVGYKVYIGPGQYFVITDIGKGMYQWYAFLGRPPNSASADDKPDGTSQYLQDIFAGWSHEIHDILKATKEDEIEQRDLYDRPPSVFKSWVDGRVALLGDGVHAMMPNLGQGGCQAIEDAYVLSQELRSVKKRSEIKDRLEHYQRRRLIRSAAVQGLSRFASDIIIRGFDTPAKVYRHKETGQWVFENFNYAGIVTKMLQPILPLFFTVQFNFLYDGWRNEREVDLKSAVAFGVLGTFILFLLAGSMAEVGVGMGVAAEALLGGELALDFEAITTGLREFFNLSL